jgi:hypothetical protein
MFFYTEGVPLLPSLQTSEVLPLFTQTAWHEISVTYSPTLAVSPDKPARFVYFARAGD